METKKGSPRRYKLEPVADFKNRELAMETAALIELSERVVDQIEDLPPVAMTHAVGETGLTIGWLAVHMIWAECGWTERASGRAIPVDIVAALKGADLGSYGATAGSFSDPSAITRLYDRARGEFTLPALREVVDIDRGFESRNMQVNVRGIMAHLVWHWTYHSGQIGLIRLMWGSDYAWSFDKDLVFPKA
jgi:uncharacterized damage-inducible protein DinB